MSKVPLIVYLDGAPILGKDLLEEVPSSPYSFSRRYTLPAGFTGVKISLSSGEVGYFCGAFAVGYFESHCYRVTSLTDKQRKSIYRRTMAALRRFLNRGTTAEGYKQSNCIVIGDYERKHNYLSLWEMGHMLPCQRTVEYVNKNSNNLVRMFVFNP